MRLVAAALYEFARRRRDAKRFAFDDPSPQRCKLRFRRATVAVTAERPIRLSTSWACSAQTSTRPRLLHPDPPTRPRGDRPCHRSPASPTPTPREAPWLSSKLSSPSSKEAAPALACVGPGSA